MSVLTDLKNPGLKDICVACIDGLTGFPDAIKAVSKRTKVLLCVVHLVRAAMRYVVDKGCRPVAADLKKIDNAATLVEAEAALENFAQAWEPTESADQFGRMKDEGGSPQRNLRRSPRLASEVAGNHHAVRFHCDEINTVPIRRAISTTNAIESVDSVIHKLTRNRKISPNEDSALKITDLAIREASKR